MFGSCGELRLRGWLSWGLVETVMVGGEGGGGFDGRGGGAGFDGADLGVRVEVGGWSFGKETGEGAWEGHFDVG